MGIAVLALSFAVFAEEETQAEPTMDIVATAAADTGFSTLVELVVLAGLEEALAGTGPFTVFAPVNSAFAALDTGTVAYLTSTGWADDLASILTYHVVDGLALAADVQDGLGLVTLNGQKVTFSVSGDVIMLNNARVIATDVLATNGVIHVIDSVLLPSTDEVVVTGEDDLEDSLDEGIDIDTTLDDIERVEGWFVAVNLQDAVDYLYTNGLTMFGTVDTFMGEQNLRRDEAAAFFARFARDVLAMEVDADAACVFQDLGIAHESLLAEIEAACQLWLFKWHEWNFMPVDTFSNAHAVTVLVRLLEGTMEEPEDNWSINYYNRAKELGLTAGLAADTQANLYAPITRADVALMIEAAAQSHNSSRSNRTEG